MKQKETPPSYYDLLDVSPDASLETIRKAYRKLVSRYHPDLLQKVEDATARTEGEAVMKELNAAMAILSDPHKRNEYDRTLTAPPSPREQALNDLMDKVFDTSLDEQTLDTHIAQAVETFGFTDDELRTALEDKARAHKGENAPSSRPIHPLTPELKQFLAKLVNRPDKSQLRYDYEALLKKGDLSREAFEFFDKTNYITNYSKASCSFFLTLSLLEKAIQQKPDLSSNVLVKTLESCLKNEHKSPAAASLLALVTKITPKRVFSLHSNDLLQAIVLLHPLSPDAEQLFFRFFDRDAIGPNWMARLANLNDKANFTPNHLRHYSTVLDRLALMIEADPSKISFLPEDTVFHAIALGCLLPSPRTTTLFGTTVKDAGEVDPVWEKSARELIELTFRLDPQRIVSVAQSKNLLPFLLEKHPSNGFSRRLLRCMIDVFSLDPDTERLLIQKLADNPKNGFYRRTFSRLLKAQGISDEALDHFEEYSGKRYDRLGLAASYLECLKLIKKAGRSGRELRRQIRTSLIYDCITHIDKEAPKALLDFIHGENPEAIFSAVGHNLLTPKLTQDPTAPETVALFETMQANNFVTDAWIDQLTKANQKANVPFHPVKNRQAKALLLRLQKQIQTPQPSR